MFPRPAMLARSELGEHISSIKSTEQGETRTLERTFSKAIRAISKSPSDSIHSRSEVHHKYQFLWSSNRGKRINCKMKVDIFYIVKFSNLTLEKPGCSLEDPNPK